jgi:hypothetical protein
MNKATKSETDIYGLITRIAILTIILILTSIFIYLIVVDNIERSNLLKKTISIGEEGYLRIIDFPFLNKDSARYFTIKVNAVDVQNDNNNKIVTLYATFKNINFDIVDISYDYYLVTDEGHSYQSTALLTDGSTRILKDTHKECVIRFSIPVDEKPTKLVITQGNSIVKEVVLRHN